MFRRLQRWCGGGRVAGLPFLLAADLRMCGEGRNAGGNPAEARSVVIRRHRRPPMFRVDESREPRFPDRSGPGIASLL
jgi:hypothetical protein